MEDVSWRSSARGLNQGKIGTGSIERLRVERVVIVPEWKQTELYDATIRERQIAETAGA